MPSPEAQRTTNGIVVITSSSLGGPDTISRQTARGIQRLGAYAKIWSNIDTLRLRLRNEEPLTPNTNLNPTNRFLPLLERAATTMYRNEFSSESWLEASADDIRTKRLPKAEAVVAEVELYIRSIRFNIDDVHHEVDMILHQPTVHAVVKQASAEAKELVSQIAEKQRQEKQEREMREKAANLKPEEVVVFSRPKLAYVHDPTLDEPSKEAAAYIEELFNRPY